MSDYGVYYFSTPRGKLYFGKEYGNFYFYSIEGNDEILKMMYLALSTMPISNINNIKWKDRIGNSMVLNSSQRLLANFINSLSLHNVYTQVEYYSVDKNLVKGKIYNKFFNVNIESSVEFDPIIGFKEIKINNYTMKANDSIL